MTPRSFVPTGNSTALTALLGLWFAAALLTGAPPAPVTERESPGNNDTKSLYVTVQKDDKIIGGLEARNFRLYVDAEGVPFKLEEPESPATIALLIEFSRGSWFYVRDIVRAMEGFHRSAPEGNWYALATFAHELKIAQDFTKQRGKIGQAFSTLRPPNWDEVDTYDALYTMLDRMGRMKGRRVLIFVGSGFDTFSERTLDDVIEKAESVNVVVYALGAGSMLRGVYDRYLSSFQRLDLLQAQNLLQSLADKTGGWAQFPRFEAAFPDVMKGIMQMLQFQYKLTYRSPPPAKGDDFQEVEVQAFVLHDDEREDFDVYVREGWRY